jgi:hypothetical protein
MNKYLLIGVFAILVIAGGWWYTTQSTQLPSQQNANNKSNLNTNMTTSKPGWIVTTNEQLNVRFENPTDASVSTVERRQTVDSIAISTLVVTPKGMDSTVVHFFTTDVSLEQAKNIQFYQSDISNSEFVDATIDGLKGIRRIDHHSYNDCTNELTVAETNGIVYGSHIVQCPTHPAGYDQLRKDIANSLEIL